jgi:hypothetical protein
VLVEGLVAGLTEGLDEGLVATLVAGLVDRGAAGGRPRIRESGDRR